MNKTYWVLSQGEQPAKIFFTEERAKSEGANYSDPYLDVFDDEGNKVQSLKYEWFTCNWTEDF